MVRLVQYDAMRCYTDTHDQSLSVIPTAKQPFAGIALLLVVCVLPGLSRHLLPPIVIAIIAYTSWHGLSWLRLAGSPDDTLRLVGSIGLPNNFDARESIVMTLPCFS
jgi:hypothetical protein